MRIKRLKKLRIGDTVFNVKWDKNNNGGSFGYPTDSEEAYIVIGIGLLKTNPTSVFAVLIHELKEIIQEEQRTRNIVNNGYYEFHYGHKEHTDLCSRLAGLLSEFIE